ncbi:MAG TPA: molybdate transporter family protein [Solirubrobacterales bacterium]|nr:molybdate transporter family protein [Solirubrobacterales bacterium]
MRKALRELSGGLGDVGMLVPLAVAMVAVNGLNATAVFGGAGLLYMATALCFRVPVSVQPLKAFAAAAIALELDAATIAAGALMMSGAMGALAWLGLADRIAARFPLVLVRGIQASVALLLARAAVELAEKGNWPGLAPIDPNLSLAIAAVSCGVLFACRRSSWLPGSLIVLAAGVGVGVAAGGLPQGLEAGPAPLGLSVPSGADWGTALTALLLAQLPLTFGNSIVATADVERAYFGARARRVTPNRLAASIAGANLLAGLTAGLPSCHGAGGVTAHYKLGARALWATFAAGAIFLALAVAAGSSLPLLLTLLPPGALAGMLLFVAVQHALLAATLERLDDRLIAAGVGAVTLLSGNLGIGFLAGATVVGARAALRRVAPPGRLASATQEL